VWQRVLGLAAGAAVPDRREFDEHYAEEWLDEVPMAESFAGMASLVKVMRDLHVEPARVEEVRLLIDLADGKARRFRCVVERLPRTASFSKCSRPRCRQPRTSIESSSAMAGAFMFATSGATDRCFSCGMEPGSTRRSGRP